MEVRGKLIKEIQKIIAELSDESTQVKVDVPTDLGKGDFSTNIAMRLGGNPIELAEKIVDAFEKVELASKFKKIEVAKPGFINFYLSDSEIISQSLGLFAKNKAKNGEELILEFGDLNPFKEPHIGHLRNFALGESLARLFEAQGLKIIRANYQGDVGPHVAKAIWGIMKQGESKTLDAKVLTEAYAKGARAYEEDPEAKKEIDEINIKVYQKHPQVIEIWEKGRKISLEYFETLYRKLGVKYHKYYFESETAPVGKKIVEENTPKIFEKDDGALIFRGEKAGLHTRVFVTSNGNPMYEAKDLALAILKDKDFPDAKSLIMTANEQSEYFKVMIAALSEIDKKIADKTTHLSYGFVNLKEGKMSSRTGNVVSAFWLLDETKKRLKEGFKEVPAEVLDQLAVASVKWAMLKFSRESNISFSIEESVQIEGNSGPYMLYAYARTQSLLEKATSTDFKANLREKIQPELVALLRIVCQFEIVVNESSRNFSPNILTNYLYVLAQNFNQFYEKEKVVGSPNEDEKMAVINIIGETLKNGLYLLGIASPAEI